MAKKKPRRKAQKPYPVIPIAGGLLLIGFAFLFMALPRGDGRTSFPSSVVPLHISYLAPGLSLENIDGRTESLADYRKDIVLVNNWATWWRSF